MENNFETYQEFNESTADMINKTNLITLSLNNSGYDNKIVNPELNIVFLNDKSYIIPDTTPSKTNFSIAGWTHSNSVYNRKKCVMLGQIVTEQFATYNDLKNTKLFNLNLKSDMHLYTESRMRIEQNSVYIFAIEYDIYNGTYQDKDLSLNAPKYYNTSTSSYDDLQFNSTNTNFNISSIRTVLNNNGRFVKYYYIKSGDNYLENNALFRFEISATTTNNTAKIRIYNTNFYKGDILFNALSTKNNNMIKQNDNILSISENGYDYTPIINPNVVTVGKFGANYSSLTSAIDAEKDNTVFELISNITDSNSVAISKSNLTINGNSFVITFSSTLNISGGNNTFNNVKFDFNNISNGLSGTITNNKFNNCVFSNSTSIGLNLTNSNNNTFDKCIFSYLVSKSIVLTNCNNNTFNIDNLKNFYKSGTSNSRAIEISNSKFNTFNIVNCDNYVIDENSGLQVIQGDVDSILYLNNSSNYNSIEVQSFYVYTNPSTPYTVFKFYNSIDNNLKLHESVWDSLYDYIYSDGGKNYLNNYTTITVSKKDNFPQVIYTDQVNDALNGTISTFSTPYRIVSPYGVNIQNAITVGLQALNITNSSTTTHLQIFGNSGTATSNHDNENLTVSGTGTNNLKTLNIKADNTTISGNILADIIIPNNTPYTRFKRADFAGSQAIQLVTENDGNSTLEVFGYQSTPDGMGSYVSNHDNENLSLRGSGTNNLKTLNIKADNTTISGFTKLGSDAPALKNKLYMGTTAADPLTYLAIYHNLDISKIISAHAMFYTAGDTPQITFPNNTIVNGYDFYINSTSMIFDAIETNTLPPNSTYKILVSYIE